MMTLILLVGGADTSRAPIAAALLRRQLAAQGRSWAVESAGVLGHDGDPAEIEARDTMAHFGIDISAHQARTLTDHLARQAALLLAVDNGTALVVRARFPEAVDRTYTLGELAGRARDIPDPFRMQIGAWITYAREIEALITAALPRIIALLPQEPAAAPPEPSGQTPGAALPDARDEALARLERLLQVVVQMPGVVDWSAARTQIEADLSQITATPRDASDLAAAYGGLLRAALAMTPAAPTAGQAAALQAAIARLAGPIQQAHLNDLSLKLTGWTTFAEKGGV